MNGRKRLKGRLNIESFCEKLVPSSDIFQLRDNLAIHELYSALVSDNKRNELIVGDVLEAIRSGRCPLVLTERKEHLAILVELLSKSISNIIVLKGGMGRKERKLHQKTYCPC